MSDFDRFKATASLNRPSLVLRRVADCSQVQKARQSRARAVRGGVRKANKGKAPAAKAGGKK